MFCNKHKYPKDFLRHKQVGRNQPQQPLRSKLQAEPVVELPKVRALRAVSMHTWAFRYTHAVIAAGK